MTQQPTQAMSCFNSTAKMLFAFLCIFYDPYIYLVWPLLIMKLALRWSIKVTALSVWVAV